ncbi:hypothetical protein [Brevibacillus sp. DP1.3A]|uniref:hypothetical protein n=1 Tax=Brevibacillus sp. DP1.3A TaxID=2738867 RepID=UPI00156AD5D9|nr:hypothetical protein [Brevibacillus sp. DP1.3A]UED76376.1 hypothetical protein HP399_007725 [Brevibacillus sp. DP1.3A]
MSVNGLPPNAHISFRENVTQPELRQAAERSIATLITSFEKKVEQMLVTDTSKAKVQTSVNAQDDRSSLQSIDLNIPDTAHIRTLAIVPPFDFTWSWFLPDGSPPTFQNLNNETGEVGLIARSGAVSGVGGMGAPGFIAAHAGFGIMLSTDREVTATGYAARRFVPKWHLSSIESTDSVMVEAGTELTVLKDGQLVNSASGKLFSESVHGNGGGRYESSGYVDVTNPPSISFAMSPGHQYTFNVGIWVVSNKSGSQHAFAESWLSGAVLSMSVVRPLL